MRHSCISRLVYPKSNPQPCLKNKRCTKMSIHWTAGFGHDLIQSVSFSVGGDDRPYWYCTKCRYRLLADEPSRGTVCNRECTAFSKAKYAALCDRDFPFLQNDEEARLIMDAFDDASLSMCDRVAPFREKLNGEWQKILDDLVAECEDDGDDYNDLVFSDFLRQLVQRADCDIYDRWACPSTDFELKRREGQVVDSYNADYLNLWSQFTTRRDAL